MNTKNIQDSLSDEKVGYKTRYSVMHVLSYLFMYTEKKHGGTFTSVNRIYLPKIFFKFSVCLSGNSTGPIMNVYCINNKKKKFI